MIVLDASTVVGAALRADSVPERAPLLAAGGSIALSAVVDAEIADVLNRPRFARAIARDRRMLILDVIRRSATWFEPATSIRECRDPDDDMYLDLARASRADVVVSSDGDLLALHPWRSVAMLRPADHLARRA